MNDAKLKKKRTFRSKNQSKKINCKFDSVTDQYEQLEETRLGRHLLMEPVAGSDRHQPVDIRRLLHLEIERLQDRIAGLDRPTGKWIEIIFDEFQSNTNQSKAKRSKANQCFNVRNVRCRIYCAPPCCSVFITRHWICDSTGVCRGRTNTAKEEHRQVALGQRFMDVVTRRMQQQQHRHHHHQ